VTVLSRCLQFSLKNLRLEVLEGHLHFVLAQEAVVAEAPAVLALARAAKGSVRDALSLTDQAIAYGGGAISLEAVSQMLGLVQREALLATAELLAGGRGLVGGWRPGRVGPRVTRAALPRGRAGVGPRTLRCSGRCRGGVLGPGPWSGAGPAWLSNSGFGPSRSQSGAGRSHRVTNDIPAASGF
jgi:hypothetical protein